ncbi:MAG: DUF3795 domain-containing protein [Firmicutes bacterium]|jgi:hypothetical protein|nr:DUF3795 domain-containing protein [Bacillota bacterium]
MAHSKDALWTHTEDGLHIVSKCGLYCDTCPAFIHGLCAGCPKLSLEDCVVKACAHRKEIATCQECTRDSCYHFEAYYERRQMVRRRTKRLMARGAKAGTAQGDVPVRACGPGGCGPAGGGCGGCGVAANGAGGCSAVERIMARLNANL